jgi:hypothetical protein
MWLAYTTRLDLCIVTYFLSQYNKQPSSGRYDAVRYELKYILGTIDHGIWFTGKPNTTLVNFIGFVPPPNTTFSDIKSVPQNASIPTPSQPPIRIDTTYTRSLY